MELVAGSAEDLSSLPSLSKYIYEDIYEYVSQCLVFRDIRDPNLD